MWALMHRLTVAAIFYLSATINAPRCCLDAVEDENWLRVRLISWNLAGKVRAIGDQLEALCERRADLVTLGEVRLRSVPALRAGFAAMGLIHVAESAQLATAHKR